MTDLKQFFCEKSLVSYLETYKSFWVKIKGNLNFFDSPESVVLQNYMNFNIKRAEKGENMKTSTYILISRLSRYESYVSII